MRINAPAQSNVKSDQNKATIGGILCPQNHNFQKPRTNYPESLEKEKWQTVVCREPHRSLKSAFDLFMGILYY